MTNKDKTIKNKSVNEVQKRMCPYTACAFEDLMDQRLYFVKIGVWSLAMLTMWKHLGSLNVGSILLFTLPMLLDTWSFPRIEIENFDFIKKMAYSSMILGSILTLVVILNVFDIFNIFELKFKIKDINILIGNILMMVIMTIQTILYSIIPFFLPSKKSTIAKLASEDI